jgi:uncharacterized protein (TIGR01777 family)
MTALLTLLTIQAVLGGIDNFWHHEVRERLAAKRSAANELSLHAAREFIYALVFLAFAWWEWHGGWALVLAALVLIEIPITLADFVVEDRTRRLPPLERVLHSVLAINFGIVLAALAPVLHTWWSEPTAVIPANYGRVSWVFTVFAAGLFAWSIRNLLAVLRHTRPPEWVREPIGLRAGRKARTVLVTGATGFIGHHLVRRLLVHGDTVIVLTREQDKALDRFGPHVRVVTSLTQIGRGTRVDAVVNLAGAPILALPWTRARRRRLVQSRANVTREVISLCSRLAIPPRVLVNASAIGYYGVRGDEEVDELGLTQPVFQSQLCREWEAIAVEAEALGVRVVRLRLGLVLGRDGGALPQLARPVKLGLGAILGSGRQWISWIHIDDVIRLVSFALRTPSVHGALNAVAPRAVTHAQMQRALAATLHRPLWLKIPALVLRTLLGEMAQLLVDGQRVVPRRAVDEGFTFRFPELQRALTDLLRPSKLATSHLVPDVYYNGNCPVCSTEIDHYARICAANAVKIRFVDAMRAPDDLVACGLRGEHLERRMYLRDASGIILSGMPALREIWSRLPGYRWLAKAMALPVLRQSSEIAYDHVISPGLTWWARRRHAHRAANALNPMEHP